MTAKIVVDLGFGDAGKGTTVDFLTRKAARPVTVVRFNGGAQAAHNVVTPEGLHHTFAQFGSGTFVPSARTHLSRFMLVNPLNMENEARHLIDECRVGNPYAGMTVDGEAMVITKFHRIANRVRETRRGKDRHGSCGQGIGETMALHIAHPELTIRVRDLRNEGLLRVRLRRQLDWMLSEFEYPEVSDEIDIGFEELLDTLALSMREISQKFTIVDGNYLAVLAKNTDLIFEGSQGVLLDETWGFHPYTTWSTCTFRNAMTLLAEIDYAEPITKYGVLRAYMTRHGPGPFPTEDAEMTKRVPDCHNGTGVWQGDFRVGHFDAVLARYAIDVCEGIDKLVVTNIDRLTVPKLCTEYTGGVSRLDLCRNPTLDHQRELGEYLVQQEPVYQNCPTRQAHLGLLQEELGIPISIYSSGPTHRDKIVVVGSLA